MKKLLTATLSALILFSACADQSLLIPFDDDKPAYAKDAKPSASGADSRAPLDVPPELRAELELPMGEQVGRRADAKVLPEKYQQEVAGNGISLDARVYKQTPAQVFSAVVDAMTSLNVPVEAVDSPSGIVTSDWIRKGANYGGLSLFGASDSPKRYRFIVRVYRAVLEGKKNTKLEIRVLGQSFVNGHWTNKPFKRKISNELFVAVEEQLTRMQREKEK